MLNILAVEDNLLEMDHLCTLIKKIEPDCTLIKADSAENALALSGLPPIDLFFLDVELPGMSGFQLAQKIRATPQYLLTPIIFTTGCTADHFAVQKRYHHYDYLIKPITWKDFSQQLQPLFLHLQEQKLIEKPAPVRQKIIPLNTKNDIFMVLASGILYAEASRKVIHVTTEARVYKEVKMSLDDLIESVDAPCFVRCHKSFAINLNQVTALRKTGRRLWTASFFSRETAGVQISETYYEDLNYLFQQHLGKGWY